MTTIEKIFGSNVVILWLDEHIGQEGNCNDLKQKFESNTTNIITFFEVEQCRQFLPLIKDKKLFAIIQGTLAKDIVPDIVRHTTSPVIYIFCALVANYSEWAQDYDCILQGGIFEHEDDLLGNLTRSLSDYAALKVHEYSVKRAACDEWAKMLINNAKRFRHEKYTLTYASDPFSAADKAGEEPKD